MENDFITARVLRTIEKLLGDESLLGSITDPRLRVDVDIAAKLLGVLARRASGRQVDLAQHARQRDALASEARDLLGAELPIASPDYRLWSGGPLLQGLSPAGGRQDDSIFALLAAAMSAATDPERRTRAEEIFQRFLALEEGFIARTDPDAVAGVTAQSFSRAASAAAPAANIEGQIDETTLTAYLRARFPNEHDIHAKEVRKLVGGYSKETILFRIEGNFPFAGPVAMRKDMPIVARPGSVTDELSILEHAWKAGIPVPEPLWAETDPSWFEGAFIIVREVRGSNETGWSADPAACRRFAEQIAAAMAKVHLVRPADLGLDEEVPSSAREAQQRHVAWVRELYRTSVDKLNPRIEAAFGWLMENIPEPSISASALVHAGIGFHNLMMEDGNLIAVLDWELAHFGDPADDLAYTRQFIDQIMPWEDFLEHYYRHGGGAYRPEQDRYYTVWRSLRNACGAAGMIARYLGSDYETVQFPFAGLVHGPRFELQALRDIAAHIAS